MINVNLWKHSLITALLLISVNTAVIANENQQCQSILSAHANQQHPTLTPEEQKTLGNCNKTANWCMLYGLHIPNCQNNLHHAITTETPSPPSSPATTKPIPVVQPPAASPTAPASETPTPEEEVETAPINHQNETTTTTSPQPDKKQTKPDINWF